MRTLVRFAPLLVLALAGCSFEDPVCCTPPPPAFRVVNAYTTPVDVLVDGRTAYTGMPAGEVRGLPATPGSHTLVLSPSAGGPSISLPLTISGGATMPTLAAVRTAAGLLAATALDDTGSVVPADSTKVRVLHLAPNAGTLQVYRIQPDWPHPVQWQFPFVYQAEVTSLNAPFIQSTVGTWEIRIWQTPADSTGWDSAPEKVVIPLASGERKTVVILDKAGGGVRTELF